MSLPKFNVFLSSLIPGCLLLIAILWFCGNAGEDTSETHTVTEVFSYYYETTGRNSEKHIVSEDGTDYHINYVWYQAFDEEAFHREVKKGDPLKITYYPFHSWLGDSYYAIGLDSLSYSFLDQSLCTELIEKNTRVSRLICFVIVALGMAGFGFTGYVFWKECRDPKRAVGFCAYHRTKLLEARTCGCFYCLRIFGPNEILDWTDDGKTALCPYCGSAAVLGDNFGYPVKESFLQKMHEEVLQDE